MKDHPIKCTRCKHKCNYSDLEGRYSKKYGGCTELVCPRCGCRSYYDLSPWFAWSWASGLIELGEQPPELAEDGSGCIVFAKGPRAELKAVVSVLARHGKGDSAGRYLVPGVPEASSGTEAIDAFSQWVDWCMKRNARYAKKGVMFSRNQEELAA